jgi:hypothetical protein
VQFALEEKKKLLELQRKDYLKEKAENQNLSAKLAAIED